MPQMYPLPAMALYIYMMLILFYLLPYMYFMKTPTLNLPSFKHTCKMSLSW
uniref:ATP synthase protein 8 n=1 Tax=Xenophyes cascus TaxID=984453 RepID=A0A077UQI8_9HEMI|nr:ATP synthase protein 8 [Xenophyes cascus]